MMMQPFKYEPKVNSGNLRNRVSVHGKTKTTNEQRKTTYVDGKLTRVWADIIPQTGKLQNQQSDTILTNVTHKFITRYNKTIAEAYQDDERKGSLYIMYKGHRFDVRYILNPYFRDEKLEIFVEEVIG